MKSMKLFVAALAVSVVSAFVLATPQAFAATFTWTGGAADGDVTDVDNWDGVSAPGSSDDVVFPSDVADTTVTFDGATTYTSITFSDDSDTNAYTLEGTGPLTVGTGGITNSSDNSQTIEVPVVLGGDQSWTATSGILVTGTVNLSTYTLTITGTSQSMQINGVISGTGGITKTGTGTLALGAANTFSGAVSITAGYVQGLNAASLGTTAGATTVASGAGLIFYGLDGGTVSEPLSLAGSGLAFYKSLGGGPGIVSMSSATYSGDITLTANAQIYLHFVNLKIDGGLDGDFTLSVGNQSIGEINLQADPNDSETGNGTVELAASATNYEDDSPGTSINVFDNATAIVTGTYGQVSVFPGGTIKGSGTVGILSVYGTIAPGLSPGCLSSGNLSFAPSGTYSFEVNGTEACDEHDQIIVTGTVSLDGTLVVVRGDFVPTAGQKFVIISNDAADAVTGTFATLAEGDTFEVDGVTYSISYVGGDGNDVELTVTAVSPDTGFGMLTSNPYVTMAVMVGAAGAIAFMARKHLRPALSLRRK